MFMPDPKRIAGVAEMLVLTLVAIPFCGCGTDGAVSMEAHGRPDAFIAPNPAAARHFDAYNAYRAIAETSSPQGETLDGSVRDSLLCSPRMFMMGDW